MNIEKLREELERDEGFVYEIYNDHLGYPTFGIGHLITTNDPEHGMPIGTKITDERVNEVFQTDVELYISETKSVFPGLENKPDKIQLVLVNMCFNLGAPRLRKFKKFIAAIEAQEWLEAALEMMDSQWAKQVGPRAIRLKQRILKEDL